MAGFVPQRIPEGFPNQRLVVVPDSIRQRCKSLPLIKDLYVTHIGSFPTAPHHYIDRPAGIPEAVLIYCLSGAGLLRLAGKSFALTQGDLVALPPRVPHTYQATADDPWSVFWVHFTGDRAGEALASIRASQQSPTLRVPDVDKLRSAFEDLFATLSYHYTDAGLLATTAGLMRMLSEVALRQSTTASDDGRPAAEQVEQATRFMRRHLDKKLSLQDLAASTGLSVSHFGRVFRGHTGQSAIAYFLQLKVRKAAELLDRTDMTVNQIAVAVGYEDPYYFSRLFKKLQGCSPTDYRLLVKG